MRDNAQSYLDHHVTSEQSRAVSDFLDGLPEPEGDIFEVIEEAEYDAARRMDPGLPPFAYLVIRLTGDAVSAGGVNHDVANELLGPISAEIQSAADKNATEAEMTLVRISKGSLVLHYQPKQPIASHSDDQADLEISPVDRAIRDTFILHNMLESNEKPAAIAGRFGDNKKFMRAARNLTEALDSLDLNMQGKWRSPTGGRAQSKLTESGRTYARGVFQKIYQPESETVSGRITALDIDGIVTVQQTAKRKRRVHLEDPTLLTAGDFVLGAEVHLLVEKTEARDQVGLSGKERLLFRGHVRQGEFEFPAPY